MKAIINIKADKETKEKAHKVARELGLPLSTIINAYLRQFTRNKEIYFSLSPRMTPGLEKIIGGAKEDLKAKRSVSPVFSSAKAMDDYLDSL
ncbi:MAG: hypothetical protein A3H64_00540 [Candidatus Ryanbacteria bacterium RIFCSPLOWO2_02_FULL_45_11c]|uniref:Damage-inducible protein J n=1 Tax=Candidatus Ryanbacteria bacterium RIFCSPLOWO2_02_FULL_45_11c TaxID=1802128 RepID=A0A1G2H1S7_9BACT|nr:MAG: hypothetical protein A3H64_00540 [Candidatus Ryanbacteria bacterium RIFCSPLOWO2_02_FULL_45_11c]